ncbi:MAG: protein-glutamate O-methyltransferase CheR [Gemmatimonadota bacterium]
MRDEANGRRGAAAGYGADVLGFSETAFVLLRDLIAEQTGLYFADDKRDLLADKLSDLMARLGTTSYLDYYYLLRYDGSAERYWGELVDRLSVPETYFWRQPEQIVALANIVAPRHFERSPATPLRIWSAACCTGEEPISIAIALAESGLLHHRPIQITGSDLSGEMLNRARRGVYGERSFRSIPGELRQRYFEKADGGWRVDPSLHAKITWTSANLVNPVDVRPLAAADVIFCRNVLIYFSDESIVRIARSFAADLADDGYLFLGASESLTRLDTDFELTEVGDAFVYVKAAGFRSSRASTASERAYTHPGNA